MELKGKKIVVIGGAGLIGSHTVDLLTRTDVREILVYDNFSRGSIENLRDALRDPRVRIFEAGGDIGHVDVLGAALQGADGVFHFAALWLLQSQDYPRSAFDVNVTGTFNVLEQCVQRGIKRLVFSSSASVYGEAGEEPITEDHPFNNRTFYGATKIAGEAMLRAFYHRYDLSYVGLRYMNVYGPRQDYRGAYTSVIMKMLDSIESGEPIVLHGDGDQSFDFVHVTDCAEANLRAMEADTADRFYNVGTGVGTSLKELAQLIASLKREKLSVTTAPASPFVTNRVGSIERAQEEIGFRAQVKLREGLEQLMGWRDRDRAGPSGQRN